MLDNGWLLIVFLAWLEGCFGFDCKGSELFWIVQIKIAFGAIFW